MKLFAVQPDIAWEDKAENFNRVRRLLKSARIQRDSLVVLPEMFSTGFTMNAAVTRRQPELDEARFLAVLAEECGACVVGGVISHGTDEMGRNEAVAFSPAGMLLGRYGKIHLSCLGGEAQNHQAGSEIVTFEWNGFTIAPFVCYDLRFPEIFRAAARRGANLFVVIALWPRQRQHHWLTLLQARAIENQAYVVGVNRVGDEPELSYSGRSVVVSPHGIIIADAGEHEGILEASLDVETVNSWRHVFPALRNAWWKDSTP